MTYHHMCRDANGIWTPGYWDITKEDEYRIRQAALDAFINDGMLSTTIEYADLYFEIEDYLSKEEIALLKRIEEDGSEHLWEKLTVSTLEKAFKLLHSYLNHEKDKRSAA